MADKSHMSPPGQRHPSLIGAGLLVGAIAGAAIGGATGNFAIWVPLVAAVGLGVGLFLHRSETRPGEE